MARTSDSQSFTPEERELFALFARYPNISFDTDSPNMVTEAELEALSRELAESTHNPLQHLGETPSSPDSVATVVEEDRGDATELSGTTTESMPLRNIATTTMMTGQVLRRIGTAVDEGTLDYFLAMVEQSNDWPFMNESLTTLGTLIANIGQDLFPIDTSRPLPHIDNIYARCRNVLRLLIEWNLEITKQRESVAHLKTLQAFNVTPTDKYVFTIYKQRKELIAKNTSLPSERAKELLDALVVLFHIQLYGPYMDFLDVEESMEERFMKIFAAMLEKLNKWVTLYNRWCEEDVELKETYVVPLRERICNSAAILAEVRQEREVRELARSLGIPEPI